MISLHATNEVVTKDFQLALGEEAGGCQVEPAKPATPEKELDVANTEEREDVTSVASSGKLSIAVSSNSVSFRRVK